MPETQNVKIKVEKYDNSIYEKEMYAMRLYKTVFRKA